MRTEKKKALALSSAASGVRLVLNGGSDIMEQATVPIQWFFAQETIAQNPVQILIIEQSEEMGEIGSRWAGARYMYKVTDRVAFIQVSNPGKHKITVLVLNDKETTSDPMRHSRERHYSEGIDPYDVSRAIESNSFAAIDADVIAAAVSMIDVPKELFAERSRTAFGELVWKWSNRWEKEPPRDQCEYRKRLIFAFTIQPVLFVLGMLLRYLVQIVVTVLFPLIRLVIFMVGFRPNHLFGHTKEIWNWTFYHLNVGDIFLSDDVEGYRVWAVKDGKTRYMPVTGLEIISVIGLVFATKFIIAELDLTMVVLMTVGALLFFLLVYVAVRVMSYMVDRELEATRRRETYQQWLGNLSYDQVRPKVELDKLPVAYRDGLVQKFRVGFWHAKMKVCRPFSRN